MLTAIKALQVFGCNSVLFIFHKPSNEGKYRSVTQFQMILIAVKCIKYIFLKL